MSLPWCFVSLFHRKLYTFTNAVDCVENKFNKSSLNIKYTLSRRYVKGNTSPLYFCNKLYLLFVQSFEGLWVFKCKNVFSWIWLYDRIQVFQAVSCKSINLKILNKIIQSTEGNVLIIRSTLNVYHWHIVFIHTCR